jgi:nitrogen fixation/metabolism regulation signal transduction histidine kinase
MEVRDGTDMGQTGIFNDDPLAAEVAAEVRSRELLLKVGALQDAIFSSANFSIIATDERGVIQLFNVGAERMLGYAVADAVNKIIRDPRGMPDHDGATGATVRHRMSFPLFEDPIYVWADRTRLKQIVINLLSNAIKYNKEHETVVVDWSVGNLGRVRFCVRDTGEGLSSGEADATLPAVQPSRPGCQRRGWHGHRSGGDQAIG